MTNNTITLSRELVTSLQEKLDPHRDAVLWGAVCAALADQRIVCSNGILCWNSKCPECGGNGSYTRATLAEPVPPAGGEVEVLGYSVKGNRYMIRLTKGELLEMSENYTGEVLIELVDRAHVTRLQAEVEIANRREDRANAAIRKCEALQAEVERLKQVAIDRKNELTSMCAQVVDLQSELTKAREELDTLRHAVWHALDDSIEDAKTGEVTLYRPDFDTLSELVPEEWHEQHHNQSAPAAKDGE